MNLGKYEILEELGRGGFGVVYKARDVVLNRVVAVKVLHPNLVNDPGFVSRFRNEAQLAAQLDHSNIVSVYDFGEYQGLYYIAMAYMPGGSLKDLLQKKGSLPEEKALTVLSQVSDGLSYAHKKGIIHRDLKPGNILFDEESQARISDLGFAKALHTDSSVSLSMSGGLVGTPAYMAPEVWRGEPATPQTDIYSLGCILYEMLTGEALFEGKTPAEVMTRHVIDGAQFKHNLPDGWQKLLYKCLTKDPKKRFQNIKAIREAYEQFQLENNFDIESVILQEDSKLTEKLHPDSIYKTPLRNRFPLHLRHRNLTTVNNAEAVEESYRAASSLEELSRQERELEDAQVVPEIAFLQTAQSEDEKNNKEHEVLPGKKNSKKQKLFVSMAILAIVFAVVILGYVLVERYIIRPNTVVARVGNTELKVGEFEANTIYSRINMLNQINNYLQFGDMGKQYALSIALQLRNPEIVGENVLNQMVDEVIIAEKAAELGISVSDEEIEALMQEQFNFFPNGTLTPTITPTIVNTPTWSAAQFELINPTATFTPSPEPTATPDGWEPTPTDLPEGETPVPSNTPTPTPYTTQLYLKDVNKYFDYLKTYGLTRADIERVLRNGLLRDKVMDVITKDVEPTEEQVWVRHILVDGQDTAEEVIAKLKAGEPWADLAAEYSTDLANKDNGGDLGWIGRIDSYDPPFLDAAFALNEDGEISKPVQSSFGWHVIQLVTKAVNNVNAYKFEQLKHEFFTNWLTEQRENRDDIKIEDIWKEFAPSVPPLQDELFEYLTANPF